MHLGKRKRSESIGEEDGSNSCRAFQKPLDLLLAMAAFLESLNSISRDDAGFGDVDIQDQFKSVIRGTDSQAPDILRNWLLCINSVVEIEAFSVPHWTKQAQWDWIRPILPIWEGQKLDASMVR